MTIDEMERAEERQVQEIQSTVKSASNEQLVERLISLNIFLRNVDPEESFMSGQFIYLQRVIRTEILQRMGMGGDADGGNE